MLYFFGTTVKLYA